MEQWNISDAERIKRTQIPAGRVKMVLDTDTRNEVDDQFALSYALLSPDRIDLQAVYAAHYRNTKESLAGYRSQTAADSHNTFRNASAATPQEGMEKSYQEILKILGMFGKDPEGFAFRGCDGPLENAVRGKHSEAVDDLIQRAMAMPEDEPLFVVGIGACTNIASALLLEPAIMKKIVLVLLLGNALEWPDNNEFNVFQDPVAAKVVFDSGAPLIHVPAKGVTGYLRISIPELETFMGQENPLCKYLLDNVKTYAQDYFAWSKPIWDIGAIGLIVNPDWAPAKIIHSPVIASRDTYGFDPRRHLIRAVYSMDRDSIFKDMFKKLRNMEG